MSAWKHGHAAALLRQHALQGVDVEQAAFVSGALGSGYRGLACTVHRRLHGHAQKQHLHEKLDKKHTHHIQVHVPADVHHIQADPFTWKRRKGHIKLHTGEVESQPPSKLV